MTSIIIKLFNRNLQRLAISNNLTCIRCASSILSNILPLGKIIPVQTTISLQNPFNYTQIRLKFDKKKRKQQNDDEEVH